MYGCLNFFLNREDTYWNHSFCVCCAKVNPSLSRDILFRINQFYKLASQLRILYWNSELNSQAKSCFPVEKLQNLRFLYCLSKISMHLNPLCWPCLCQMYIYLFPWCYICQCSLYTFHCGRVLVLFLFVMLIIILTLWHVNSSQEKITQSGGTQQFREQF